MLDERRYWEVPEVDLNLRHYAGHPSDAIKLLKRNIEKHLKRPEVFQKDREVYSAVYNALDYYKSILYSSAYDFSTGPTFLNHSLVNMKKDYDFLAQKYNSKDITLPPVIIMNGRIKSPISAIEKIKDKIEEYLKNGTDLRYINQSLRDFMGVRIIVNPPQEVRKLGKTAELDFLQNVLIDLLDFHGIRNDDVENKYKFITVNTKNNPDKLERIQSDGNLDRLPQFLVPYVKNYVDHPKKGVYQSYHICAIPEYASDVRKPTLPPYIIPPLKTEYSFEYQLRTTDMNDEAEHGISCHDKYKQLGNYHRLSIPFYIELNQEHNKFKALNLEESCRKHFGHVPFLRIYDNNGVYLRDISLADFRDTFTSYEREDIIAGKKRIFYHPNYGIEVSDEPSQLELLDNYISPIFLTAEDIEKLNASEKTYQSILEESNATDSILTDNKTPNTPSKPKVEIYLVETAEDRRKAKELKKKNKHNISKNIDENIR